MRQHSEALVRSRGCSRGCWALFADPAPAPHRTPSVEHANLQTRSDCTRCLAGTTAHAASRLPAGSTCAVTACCPSAGAFVLPRRVACPLHPAAACASLQRAAAAEWPLADAVPVPCSSLHPSHRQRHETQQCPCCMLGFATLLGRAFLTLALCRVNPGRHCAASRIHPSRSLTTCPSRRIPSPTRRQQQPSRRRRRRQRQRRWQRSRRGQRRWPS